MSRPSRPLLYIDVSGGIVPGSLLSAATSDGAVGRWTEPQTVQLLDPANATIESVVSAYNDLVWSLAQSRILNTELLIWFSDSGRSGVRFVRNAGTPSEKTADYVPYPLGASQTYIPVSKVLVDLQNLFPSDTGIKFLWFDNTFNIMLTDGDLLFDDIPGEPVDSGLHVLNRIFGGAFDRTSGARNITMRIPFSMRYTYSASTNEPQKLVALQGTPLIGPISGVKPIPDDVTIASASDKTTSSFKLSWGPVQATNIKYYIEIDSNYVTETTDTEYIVSGLEANTSYDVKITTATSYERGRTSKRLNVKTNRITPALPTNFTIRSGGSSYDKITVSWDVPPVTEGLDVNLTGSYTFAFIPNQLTPATVPISQGSYTYENLPFMNWPYIITARVSNDVDLTPPSSITLNTLELGAPDLTVDAITSRQFRVKWTPSVDLVFIPTIELTLVKNKVIQSTIGYNADLGEIIIPNLDPDTDYTVNGSFRTRFGGYGNGFAVSVKTLDELTPIPSIFSIRKKTVTTSSITIEWDIPQSNKNLVVNLTGNYIVDGITNNLTPRSVPIIDGSYIFTNLPKDNWEYTISASVSNGVQATELSTITVKTLVSSKVPDTFTMGSVGQVTYTSIMIGVGFGIPDLTGVTIQFTSPEVRSVLGTTQGIGNLSVFKGLDPGTEYTFTATLTDGVKTSAPTTVKVSTVLLDQPALFISDIGTDNVKVGFTQPDLYDTNQYNPTLHTIRYFIYNNGTLIPYDPVLEYPAEQSISSEMQLYPNKIDGLTPNTDYEIEAQYVITPQFGKVAVGPLSSRVPFTTLPSSFTIWSANANTYDTITVRWDEPTSSTSPFKVLLRCVGGIIDSRPAPINYTDGIYKFVDLQMNTEYTITAQLTNGVNTIDAVSPLITSTINLLPPETYIVPGSITKTTFNIKWGPTNNNIQPSEIYIKVVETENPDNILYVTNPAISVDSASLLVSGAAIDTEYTVSAYFISEYGQQSGTTTISVRTFADIPAPALVGVGGIDSVTFTWTLPTNLIGYYAIFIGYNETFIPLAINEDGRLGTATLTDVTPGSTATYVARYVYRGQYGPISDPITVSTLSTKFGPIPSGVGRGDGEISATGGSSINGIDGYGFWFSPIIPRSTWIGKQFNTIRFPLVGGQGVITNKAATNVIPVQLKIFISDKDTDPNDQSFQPLQESTIIINGVGGDFWNIPYEGKLIDVVTRQPTVVEIKQTTRIYVYVPPPGTNTIYFRKYTNTSNTEICVATGIAFGRPNISFVPYGICCEFDYVPLE